MATSASASVKNNSNSSSSSAMERTGQWAFSQEISSDVIVHVGEAKFPLHKFILVAKSGYIRKMIMESTEADLTRIDLSDIPGGSEMFEKAAKFCYGVNFEINLQNVAALRCAAHYLEMTDSYCQGNLVGRTEEFLAHVAFKSLSASVAVLISCQHHHLLPVAEDLNIVQRCVDVASSKACNDANFPSGPPAGAANWWMEELAKVEVDFFKKIFTCMKSRGAKTHTLASALKTYIEKSLLRDLVRDHSASSGLIIKSYNATPSTISSSDYSDQDASTAGDMLRKRQTKVLETIVSLLPSENGAFPVNFLCYLLRSATFLEASTSCKHELEKRISAILEHVTVDDLLVLSFTMDGEKLFDLESVRRIISGFVDKEKSIAVFNGAAASSGDYYFKQPEEQAVAVSSPSMQKVAKMVDGYLGEIATYPELSISKFNGIANLVPKRARKVDDDLYRSIDIYLKAHPALDEIEREKVCSVMDALKLSYEARVHASQNKRLPVQIVLHALYYDQLKLRSGAVEHDDHDQKDAAASTRSQLLAEADVSLRKENEVLRSELMKMKLYISDLQKTTTTTTTASTTNNKINNKRPTKFFSSVSKTLGKLNPFRHGSKDTSNIDDDSGDLTTKPRRRRFSIS